MKIPFIIVILFILTIFFASASYGELLVLFDEDAKNEAGAGNFVALFLSHDAGSTVQVVNNTAYSGKSSVFCTPAQSYNNMMTGWRFLITENPGKGEYRYIRFAWRSDGGTGVMIQFPDNGNWGAVTVPCLEPPAVGSRRYIAGQNVTGWSGICVSKNIPNQWTVIERDLFADFGTWTMTGMALTPFSDGGKGDYYDSIMIAAKKTEFPKTQPVEPEGKLATYWSKVKSESH